jgi:RimJ/RimL family protein N-acetyltransferase
MIHELKQPSNNALIIDCPFPEARAVIEGNNPGWVFVDDPNTPKTALVWAHGIKGFYLVGDADSTIFLESLNDYIDQVLKPRLDHLGETWIEISGGENWNSVIESTYKNRNLESGQQWVYKLKPMKNEAAVQPEIPGDCKLLRIDRRLLVDFSEIKEESLLSKLKLFWGSENAFLKAGIGYLLVCGEEITSLCFSGFVAGNTHAIDIETRASHRRKGYAEKSARAFIEECVMRNLQPHWDCMAENVSSAQLAEKIGLTRSHTYTLYSFPL